MTENGATTAQQGGPSSSARARGLPRRPGVRHRPRRDRDPGVVGAQRPHPRTWPTGFAAEGFVALAPDLYHGKETREPDEAEKLMMGLAMDGAAQDIVAAAALPRRARVDDRPGHRRRRLLHGRQPRAVVGDPVRRHRGDGRLLPGDAVGADEPDLEPLPRTRRRCCTPTSTRAASTARASWRPRRRSRAPAARSPRTSTPAPTTRSSTTPGPRSTRRRRRRWPGSAPSPS